MTTGYETNLKVLTDHILHLVDKQETAVNQITGANRSIVDPARDVLETHGLACGATNLAISAAEAARRTAGAALSRVSTELCEELKSAASRYDDTDSAAGDGIDRCEV